MGWVDIRITKCFDDLLVAGEEIELEFVGRLFPGTHDTYWQPGDSPEFEINKIFLVVNGKTTDKEIQLSDTLFDNIYDGLVEQALDEYYHDPPEDYEPEYEPEYEPDDIIAFRRKKNP